MAILDQLSLGGTGGSAPEPVPFTYTGKYESYFDVYDGVLYHELMLVDSGTLHIPVALVADIWGIGGGGGATYTAGGGSGYTHMVTGVPLHGDHIITIGEGAGQNYLVSDNQNKDGLPSTVSGTDFCALGGKAAVLHQGGDGGSGGGGRYSFAGSNGASGMGEDSGQGAGLILSKFYSVEKNTNYPVARTDDTSFYGTGGFGYMGVLNIVRSRSYATFVAQTGGFGSGMSRLINSSYFAAGKQGVVFIRFPI